MENPKSWISKTVAVVLSVIVIDQITKIIVLNTMTLGQSIPLLGNWLKFTFTENPGMAFGLRFGPPAMITVFSILATFLIVLYLFKIGSIYRPYRISLSLVLGGALGNIIDRVFYGKILYDEPIFLGKVVDFIHFNVWRGYVPDSIPFFGGSYMALFPIWNVADMAIVLGVVGIIYFQNAFHDLTISLSEGTPDFSGSPEQAEVVEQPVELPGEPDGRTDYPG
jgi:signal peptidase II